jgi:hypothetical protein
MSWEDDEFEVPPGAPVVEKPKTVSLEVLSYEKRAARSMEEKAALEVEAATAKAAVEKARADAKNTAASKAYVASLEKKAKAAAEAVIAKEKAIREADAAEGQRRQGVKNSKRGILQPCFERDVLGIERDERTGKILSYSMCGY